MTYHCGIGEGMAALGLTPREPHFACDGCPTVHTLANDIAPAWFAADKPPPGWRQVIAEPKKLHYCPVCAVARGLRKPPRSHRATGAG